MNVINETLLIVDFQVKIKKSKLLSEEASKRVELLWEVGFGPFIDFEVFFLFIGFFFFAKLSETLELKLA